MLYTYKHTCKMCIAHTHTHRTSTCPIYGSHDTILKSLANSFPAFCSTLDSIHTYSMAEHKDMKMPSFRVELPEGLFN